MTDKMRVDKDDRYLSEKTQSKTPSSKPRFTLSKTKWIILIIALLILILLLSFAILKPAKEESSIPGSDNTQSELQNNTAEYQTLTPPQISRDATKTEQHNQSDKERVEIPGEITDLIAKKIEEINVKKDENTRIQLDSKNITTSIQFNELPLTQVLESDHFTIQISASVSLENLLAFVKQHKITNYQIYETRRENKPWFVLIKGNYASVKDAKAAIKSLPTELQQYVPWTKSGESVKKEKLPE